LPPQSIKQQKMSIRLFDLAPDFDANTSLGSIRFYEWLGDSWGVLFSHPADFTPVCTTELGAVAKRKTDFQKRNVKVIALSVDTLESHTAWISDINETQGVELDFPIIADPDFAISNLYGFVHPNASDRFTVRSVVVIAPDKRVKLIITYPASTGRNFDELIRVIDSLQLTAKYSVATPANWVQGDDVVISTAIPTEDIPAKFPKGYRAVTPYLRLTPQPDL
jgi:alkyl hydroperoxide reductase subunit AhpC